MLNSFHLSLREKFLEDPLVRNMISVRDTYALHIPGT